MNNLQLALSWSLVLALVTAVVPSVIAGMAGRLQNWSTNKTRQLATWAGVALTLIWWAIVVHVYRGQYPFDWIGAKLGTPIRITAFLCWCGSLRYLAPMCAERLRRLS